MYKFICAAHARISPPPPSIFLHHESLQAPSKKGVEIEKEALKYNGIVKAFCEGECAKQCIPRKQFHTWCPCARKSSAPLFLSSIVRRLLKLCDAFPIPASFDGSYPTHDNNKPFVFGVQLWTVRYKMAGGKCRSNVLLPHTHVRTVEGKTTCEGRERKGSGNILLCFSRSIARRTKAPSYLRRRGAEPCKLQDISCTTHGTGKSGTCMGRCTTLGSQ